MSSEEIITVSQLNNLAKKTLENQLPIVWIKGEISGLRNYSHLYFDLKDPTGKIACVMFANRVAQLDFPLSNGIQIEVRGQVTIYVQNGTYQINIERVRKVGLGALWEAYSRLGAKLKAEGLFDPRYKKPLPVFPRRIGVITSKEGSVIRDVVTTLRRRMPSIPLVIYHSAVQGNDASMQLIKAIRTANARNEVDVLIVCRGGGSMEDLWCFNEEGLAREVFNSQLPIISAVGHETDTTIIDFVADLRAATPTAAAELVVKSNQEWLAMVNSLAGRLNHVFMRYYQDRQQRLDLAQANLKLLNPVNKLALQKQQLQQKLLQLDQSIHKYLALRQNYLVSCQANLVRLKPQLGAKSQLIKQNYQRLNYALAKFIQFKQERLINLNHNLTRLKPATHEKHQELEQYSLRLHQALTKLIQAKHDKLTNAQHKLNLLNPHNILARGYTMVQTVDGQLVQNIAQANSQQRVNLIFVDGKIGALIDSEKN
jgi:exodeoxyribonuclease VII large subunit